MIVSAKGSLTERLVTSGDFHTELLDVLQEKSAELAEWINGFHFIDKHIVVFLLETASEGLRAQLAPPEELLLDRMHEELSTMVIEMPTIKEDGDER